MNMPLILATLIRVASFLFGCFVLLVTMFFLLAGSAMPQETVPVVSPLILGFFLACLISSGFFYVAAMGKRFVLCLRHRIVAAFLLTPAFALGAKFLLDQNHPESLGESYFFFIPSLVVFLCTVWPWCFASAGSNTRE